MRTIERWIELFGKLDATDISAETAIANFIIGDLGGYRSNSPHRSYDTEQLSRAIQAYARMVQQAGVTV